jgi:hypothetical protein
MEDLITARETSLNPPAGVAKLHGKEFGAPGLEISNSQSRGDCASTGKRHSRYAATVMARPATADRVSGGIRRFETYSIERRKYIRLFLANRHELKKEVAIVSIPKNECRNTR